MTADQNQPRQVAFLGPAGTFSHSAVLAYFGHNIDLRECPSIDDVFMVVESGSVDYGVVPVENSTEGTVNNTMDCLVDTPLKIVAEIVVPIEHHLMSIDETAIGNIEVIYSHQQSFAQCRKWLAKHFPGVRTEESPSNAAAAQQALQNPKSAAIAGKMAADVTGLKILESSIQDQRDNSTRFIVIGKSDNVPTGNDKTSVLIYTENRPGALFRILEPFETYQVSLTRIETRPSRVEAWDYVFFMDFEGHIADEAVKNVLAKLEDRTVEVKWLGSFPRARK